MTIAELIDRTKTPTEQAIIKFFAERNNAPADYFALMRLASDGAVADAMNHLRERGILELVPNTGRGIMQIKLRDYEG